MDKLSDDDVLKIYRVLGRKFCKNTASNKEIELYLLILLEVNHRKLRGAKRWKK